MLTVEEILTLPDLPKLELVAGNSGIKNVVSNVSVYEVPDAYKWLHGNEFVITTFLSVNSNRYEEVFSELANRKIAGVVLCYPELYYQEVPKKIVHLADKFNIPLFTATNEITYIDIMSPILRKIIGGELTQLDFTIKVMKEYNQLLLGGATFGDFTAFIYRFLAYPILLLDQDHEPVSFQANTDCELSAVTAFLQNGLSLFKSQYRTKLEQGQIMTIKHTQHPVICYPVRSHSRFLGSLVLFGTNALEDEKKVVIEQGLAALAILFIHRYADIQSQDNLKYSFLHLILEAEPTSDNIEAIRERAAQVGLDLANGLYIVLLRAPISQNNKPHYTSFNSCFKIVNKLMKNFFSKSICIRKDNVYLLFLSGLSDPALYNNIKRLLNALSEELGSITAAISPFVKHVSQIRQAYNLITQAIKIGPIINGNNINVFWAEQLEPLIYLKNTLNQDFVKWAEKKLKPLITYDKEKNIGLLETLKVLLLESDNLQQAADKLFLHKNTLVYRKQLIERLLGEDPLEKGRFHYTLALNIILLQNSEQDTN
jgi:purine catabolism regulator